MAEISWPGNTLRLSRENDVESYRWERNGEVLIGNDSETIERALLEMRIALHMDLEAQMLDPRLAHLPDDLRAIAAEFLDLHSAWGTDWVASGEDQLLLDWHVGELEFARYHWSRTHFQSMTFALPGEEYFVLQMKTMRRSADFAEFVRRFSTGAAL